MKAPGLVIPAPPARPRLAGRLRKPTMNHHGWLPLIMITVIVKIKVRVRR